MVAIQHERIRLVAFQKCGHTSLINMFQTPRDQSVVRGMAPAVKVSGQDTSPGVFYKGDDTTDWPESEWTLAFFRNPLQRAYSAYQHFIIRTLSYPLVSVPSLGRKQFVELGFEAGMTFLEFCEHLAIIDLNYDPHLRPQATSFNRAACGHRWLCQLERLDTAWPETVEHFDLPCTKEVVDFNAANYEPCLVDGPEAGIIEVLYAEDYEIWDFAGK